MYQKTKVYDQVFGTIIFPEHVFLAGNTPSARGHEAGGEGGRGGGRSNVEETEAERVGCGWKDRGLLPPRLYLTKVMFLGEGGFFLIFFECVWGVFFRCLFRLV